MLPDRGDIAWVELDSALGTEQAGRRPALVLSGKLYHDLSRRAVVCPITSRVRDWPFAVRLPDGLKTTGMILVDQVRTIDRERRLFALIEAVPKEILADVQGRLAALLGIDNIEQ
jgi:mRNA interferase MazF